MLGRYPGNEQYKISCSTAVESIKSSRSCSFYLGTDSEATPYGPFSGFTGPYGSGKLANLPPHGFNHVIPPSVGWEFSGDEIEMNIDKLCKKLTQIKIFSE